MDIGVLFLEDGKVQKISDFFSNSYGVPSEDVEQNWVLHKSKSKIVKALGGEEEDHVELYFSRVINSPDTERVSFSILNFVQTLGNLAKFSGCLSYVSWFETTFACFGSYEILIINIRPDTLWIWSYFWFHLDFPFSDFPIKAVSVRELLLSTKLHSSFSLSFIHRATAQSISRAPEDSSGNRMGSIRIDSCCEFPYCAALAGFLLLILRTVNNDGNDRDLGMSLEATNETSCESGDGFELEKRLP